MFFDLHCAQLLSAIVTAVLALVGWMDGFAVRYSPTTQSHKDTFIYGHNGIIWWCGRALWDGRVCVSDRPTDRPDSIPTSILASDQYTPRMYCNTLLLLLGGIDSACS